MSQYISHLAALSAFLSLLVADGVTPNLAARLAARSASVMGVAGAASDCNADSESAAVFSGEDASAAASFGGPPMTVIFFLAELSPSPGAVTENRITVLKWN